MSTVAVDEEKVSKDEEARLQRVEERPPLDMCLSLYDLEAVAKTTLSPQAWAYYSSGADDEMTMRENSSACACERRRTRLIAQTTDCGSARECCGT